MNPNESPSPNLTNTTISSLLPYLLTYFPFFYLLIYKEGWGKRTQTKHGLDYTTAAADERSSSFPSACQSSKREATSCWRLPVLENANRRCSTFPGVQHVWGVVDKSSGECVLCHDRYHAPPPIFSRECCRFSKSGRCFLARRCGEVADQVTGRGTPSTSDFARKDQELAPG